MTSARDYIAFVVAGLFEGTFGSVLSVLGTSTIIDIFYLRELGRALTTFPFPSMLGTFAGSKFGGFIVTHMFWTIDLGWTVALQGFISVLGRFPG